jgi:membrane fusion protein (multidrug efflux system)
MSKFSWFLIALVTTVAVIIVYNKILHKPATSSKGSGAGGPPKEVMAQGFIVSPQHLANNILASGTLLPSEEINVQAEVSGKIIMLNFQEGVTVGKGAMLAKLYDADLQAQLKKLLIQKETALKTETRLKQLLAINGVGMQEYDNASTQLNNIVADIEVLQTQISKTEIRAPFGGVIGLRNVSNGAYITPSTIITSLQQIDPLKMDFSVPEKYSMSISKGDLLKLKVDGFDQGFTGKIYAIEPRIDEATRTIKMRALLQNGNAKLMPGAFAKVDLGLKELDNALMIPSQCVIPEARSKKVIVVKGGIAQFVKVETGVRTESQIQITDGLSIGDTVVATALMYIKPDAKVKITKLIQ